MKGLGVSHENFINRGVKRFNETSDPLKNSGICGNFCVNSRMGRPMGLGSGHCYRFRAACAKQVS